MAVGAVDGPTPSAALVARLMLDLEIVSLADAMAEGCSVEETSVSHPSYRVRIGDEARLFVKHFDPSGGTGRDLKAEAAVYRLSMSVPELQTIVPACRLVTDDDSLIVMEAVGRTSLDTDLSSLTLEQIDSYARAVAAVHRVRPPPLGRPPWLLEAPEHVSSGYRWLPLPCRDLLLRVAADPVLWRGFRALRRAWRPSCLVHGDLRWSNVIFDTGPPFRTWVIDWELACRGDPAWDIGCVLADLLPPLGTGRARVSDERFVALSRAFLLRYTSENGIARGQRHELVRRSFAMMGVRLVQTLVECAHAGREVLEGSEAELLPLATALLAPGSALVNRCVVATDDATPPCP